MKLDREMDFSHVEDPIVRCVLQADWRTFDAKHIDYAVDQTVRSAFDVLTGTDSFRGRNELRWRYASEASRAFKRGDTLACLANLQLYWK